MKKTITLFFILLTTPFYSQWVEQVSGVTEPLNDVYCIAQEVVVVVGNAGTILKTTDGGAHWNQKMSGTTRDLMKVQFVNANTGFALGANGSVLKTIDGGENWFAVNNGGDTNFYNCGLSSVSENVIYICSNYWIKKSTDGGANFEYVNFPLDQNIENLQFLDEQIGYASGPNTLWKTMNGGTTWTLITSAYSIGAFFFLNADTGFIYTMSDGIYKTTDGGATFLYVGYSEGQVQDLFALNENVIWEINGIFLLCGCPPAYCVTKTDIMASPQNQQIKNCDVGGELDVELNAIHFASDTKGYMVGYASYTDTMGPAVVKGAIYKNTTGTMLDVSKAATNDALTIYPNPASDRIIVSFAEHVNHPFSVEITNCLGEKVFSKSYQSESAAIIEVSSFSKGIYFVIIVSQEKRQVQKVVIE